MGWKTRQLIPKPPLTCLPAHRGKPWKTARKQPSTIQETGSYPADSPVKNMRCNTSMRNISFSIQKARVKGLQSWDQLMETTLTIQAPTHWAISPIKAEQALLAGAKEPIINRLEITISKSMLIFYILNASMTQSIKMRIHIRTWVILMVEF